MANNATIVLMAKSGALDLGFGWEPTLAITLVVVVLARLIRKLALARHH